MIELKGKYASAKVFTDVVDQASISQVIGLLNQPYAEGSRIRMMPDIHAGMGCTIGTTMTIGDKICPDLVGVDIGCGMEMVQVREKHMELQKLDKLIREQIPSGFSIRTKPHRYAEQVDLEELHCANHVDLDRAARSIGTLGGGNHFIEVDKDEDGHLFVVIHSGSRHLGVQIAKHYMDAGWKALQETPEGRSVPKALAYVEGELLERYLHDMKIAQAFADCNRRAMMDVIVKGMGLHVQEQSTTVHNYIDMESRILRKGAVSAKAGERLLIPINMRDGSLICEGKGNEDWNFSAPHGAGRLMSRGDAKSSFTVSEFRKQMQGIYTTSVGQGTLDECPMAYKRMEDILEHIGPTVRVISVIRPVYNFKAGGGD
ncbi:MAG: RtcB family protein [Oscillospiraceae bacterium]|nr:RtcB family protein [Oscillospiraceae bacterium]